MEDRTESSIEEQKDKPKKQKKFFKRLVRFFIILGILIIAWIAFALIGRLDAAAVIPDTAVVQATIPNPSRLLDKLLAHEALNDISTVSDLAFIAPIAADLKENKLLKNRIVRLAMGGKMELALLAGSSDTEDAIFAAAYDLKMLSPLLRLLPVISNFISVPNLYYVSAGKNSRFEYRENDMTVCIGTHKNILFITNNSKIYEERINAGKNTADYKNIKISNFDAAVRLSHQYINDLLSEMDPNIAAILENLEFDSVVEAGISINQKKLEFHLSAPLSSEKPALERFIQSRSQASDIIEQLPASTQYATVLSAGTLNELYQAAFLFMPDLDEMISTANSAARFLLGITVDDLLFSWSGKEYAAFGMEGRPHPVYAIQIADEKKRQEVFDKTFSSLFINEDVRLNLDGTRIPRIALPNFLQSILMKWNINIPSPYYIIHKDFLLLSESAEALLAALRAMQRNDVLPRTDIWKNITQGRPSGSASASAAFTIYYSLDRSMPFFLRQNTAFSGYLSLYRQGLVNMSFNRGIVNLSLSLIPGSGNGVSLAGGYPVDLASLGVAAGLSNQLYGAGDKLFFAAGSSAYSMNIAAAADIALQQAALNEIAGQGKHWVIPAEGIGERLKDKTFAWVVSDRGRVTLVDGDMEPQPNFPLLTGLRISASPAAFEGRLYLCDDDGFVHVIDEKASQKKWETSFFVPLISPPSFISVPARGRNPAKKYAAAYPKTFFGELYLLDTDGNLLPEWPAPISTASQSTGRTGEPSGIGLGFGSPLVFAHNDRILAAFVCQTGELIVYDENASPAAPFPILLKNIFYQQPVFDGTYLWLIAEDGTLFRVSMEGEVLSHKIPDFYVREEGYITVLDIDNDKIPEIFITGEGNALHGYTRNFRSLEGFPLPVWGRPYFTSGKNAEVFGIGMDRKLYRWQFR